jgi:hypothetical protein
MAKNDALADLAGTERQEEAIKLSPFQQRVCAIPEEWNLALTGGRGGGKSWVSAILILRHIIKFREMARVWFIRTDHAGCADMVLIMREIFGRIWGSAVRYNQQTGVWSGFPEGGYLEVNQMSTFAEYQKWQGRSATLIVVDELGQYPTDELPNLLRSNLRGPADVPKRMIFGANPAGVGHHFIHRKFILKTSAWHPFELDDATWVNCPSTFRDNSFLDQEKYLRDLAASTAHDKELGRAFIDGDWKVTRGGAFFAGCLDEKRSMFPLWKVPVGMTLARFVQPKLEPCEGGIFLAPPDLEPWRWFLAMDWGFSAPCLTYLCGRSPGAMVEGRWFPRGSIVVLAEVSTALEGQLHRGSELPVADVALRITEMCKRYGVRAVGVADDAAGIRNQDGISVVDSFANNDVYFREAGKGSRVGGWQHVRELLNNAGKPDVPGLYLSDACQYFWSTAPFIGRSQRNIEDCEGGQIDHGADAVRYACIQRSNGIVQRDF